MKKTDWGHRIMVIIPVAEQAKANSMIRKMTSKIADMDTFGTPLSATGRNPATHLACFTSATELIRLALRKKFDRGQIVGVKWWRFSGNKSLRNTNGKGLVGKQFTFEGALIETGLKKVVV